MTRRTRILVALAVAAAAFAGILGPTHAAPMTQPHRTVIA